MNKDQEQLVNTLVTELEGNSVTFPEVGVVTIKGLSERAPRKTVVSKLDIALSSGAVRRCGEITHKSLSGFK